MREAAERFNRHTGACLEVAPVTNIYLGEEINVSGLLSGKDLLAAFSGRLADTPLFVSDRMVSQRTGTLLDDLSIADVARELKSPVVPAADLVGVARELRARSRSVTRVAA